MQNTYNNNKLEIKNALKEIWDYMKLNQPLEQCDLIIGCGCANLDIPVKCADLLKQGYAPKILFAGGLGKITANKFNKSEAEIYKDIAISNGIKEEDILIETKSTNTGDNFRFALEILKNNNIKHDKILIVHKPLNERRTLSCAKQILKDKELYITSYDITFEEYFNTLDKKTIEEIINNISVIIGDIQRLIVYPQLGWQTIEYVPKSIIDKYNYLKSLGFNKYIMSKDDITKLIEHNGIIEGQQPNYFN